MASSIYYLDHSKWIELLSRTFSNNNYDTRKMLAEHTNGDIVIPMSVMHYLEAAKCDKNEDCHKIASTMTGIATGHGILPLSAIWETEIKQAVNRMTGIDMNYSIKNVVIGKGLFYILGNRGWAAHMEFAYDPHGTAFIEKESEIVDYLLKVDWSKMFEDVEKQRKFALNLTQPEAGNGKEAFVTNTIKRLSREMMPMIVIYLKSLGYDAKFYEKILEDTNAWHDMLFSIPTSEIWIKLNSELEYKFKDTGKSYYWNDADLLATALPFSDKLFIDDFWVDRLKDAGLYEQYESKINTDLAKLFE